MATTSRRAKLMRGRVVAGLVALGAVIGLGVASASPPPSAAFDAFDGRTWLGVPRAPGSQLLLVNGISGSLEAEAVLDPAPPSVVYVGATARRTLLRTADAVLIVDNASHAVVRRPIDAAVRVALVGDDVLLMGDRVERMRAVSGADPRVIVGAPAVADAPAVVDGRGQPWYLGRSRGVALVAVAVGVDDTVRIEPVPASTRSLLVVDGRVYALGDALVAVDGGRRVKADVEGLAPSIAVGTDGTWASASQSSLTFVRDGDETTSDLGQPITDLALWHGSAYAVTAAGVTRVTSDATSVVPEIGSGASLHVDGGLLWATTPETAVAIDPDHRQTLLRLASADLSLCVGDCSAAAASTFLEQAASESPPPAAPAPASTVDKASPTMTDAPRVLEAAVVTPTLPNTTVPRPAAATTTTSQPTPTTSPVPNPVAAPDGVPDTILAGGVPSSSTTPTTNKDRDTDGSPPRQETVPGTVPRPVDPKPTSPTSTTTTTPPTTTAPDDPVELEYSLRADRQSATADIRVLARPSACGATGVATTGTVSWTGSDSGSREVLITWPSPDSPRSHETSATIVAPAGELQVTVTVCGVAATRETTIESDPVSTSTTTSTTTTTTEPPTTEPPTTEPPTTEPPTTSMTAPTTTDPTTTTVPAP